MFVHDVDGFRQLMRRTGCDLIGDFTTAFFTEANPERDAVNTHITPAKKKLLPTNCPLFESFQTNESGGIVR
jgi:hypothetical protein